jgi:molybdopterin converting factor small subunit
VKVILSGTLQRYAGYTREHDVEGATVGAALGELAREHPALASVLFDEDGSVRDSNLLFLNGSQLVRGDEGASVSAWDELEIITAIAGG